MRVIGHPGPSLNAAWSHCVSAPATPVPATVVMVSAPVMSALEKPKCWRSRGWAKARAPEKGRIMNAELRMMNWGRENAGRAEGDGTPSKMSERGTRNGPWVTSAPPPGTSEHLMDARANQAEDREAHEQGRRLFPWGLSGFSSSAFHGEFLLERGGLEPSAVRHGL